MDAYSLEEECWEYLDPKGIKRGPFTGQRMIQWHEHGMLPEDLNVRHGLSMPFVPINELFRPPNLPFRTKPRPPQRINPNEWQYEDNKGQIQGPFGTAQMKQWYEHKMLPAHLRLRRTGETSFFLIRDYFPPPAIPFLTPAITPSVIQEPATVQLGAGLTSAVAALFAASTANIAKAPAPVAAAPKQPAQPKAKANAKAKAAKLDAVPEGEEGGKGHKAKGGKAKEPQEGKGATWWTDQAWDTDKGQAWWDGWSWNGWGGEGETWENGRDRQQGAEWKEAAGASKEKPEKGSAVQAAFGSLRWGPAEEIADLFPGKVLRRVQDEGLVWEERLISPLVVRFSQGKIHPFFHERGPISEVMAQIRLKEDSPVEEHLDWKLIEPPFPPIRLLHLKEQGALVTLDNRRLYALQRFALQSWPNICLVRALCVDELTPTRLKAENRKFTNRICGMQLEVESRSNAFDTFSWVTEAAHSEAPRFCRPVALRAVERLISLLPILVVHTLLCKRFRPYLRSRWPLLRFLSTLLPNPQRREFPSKRVLLHHVLQLSRPSHQAVKCPALCVAYKSETVVTLSKDRGRSAVTSKFSIADLSLVPTAASMSHIQRQVLAALLPMSCMPYVRYTLKGRTQDWVASFLLAWGKVAASQLRLPAL